MLGNFEMEGLFKATFNKNVKINNNNLKKVASVCFVPQQKYLVRIGISAG